MNVFSGRSLMVLLLIIGQCNAGYGQKDFSKFQIGATAGLFIYQGDLTPSRFGSFRTPGFTGSIFLNRIINTNFSLRANLAFGKLHGDDGKYSNPEWRQQRNFNFSTPAIELSALLVWNPLGTDRTLSPYIFGGGGLTWLKISRDWSRFNGEYFANEPAVQGGLNIDAARRLPRLIPVIPVGAGIQYRLNDRVSLLAESAYRITATDYLDGFSRSANPARFDHYQNYSVGMIYRLGKKAGIDCPVVN